MSNEIRLQRLLADRGVASRRASEELIREGKVTVNGETAKLGMSVNPRSDRVMVNDRTLPAASQKAYYLLYKKKGVICTRNDPEGRTTVFDGFQFRENGIESVGRLDIDTEGAILLTNDGVLARNLTHPSRKVPKRYSVKVYRTPTERNLELIRKGRVYLDGVPAHPAKIRVVETNESGNCWLEITVTEGRNKLIRNLFSQLGHPVSKLRRESFATLSLRSMERGGIRPLTKEEVERITQIADGKSATSAGHKKRGKGFAVAKPKNRRGGMKKKPPSPKKRG
jgi:pseudouridine synthase